MRIQELFLERLTQNKSRIFIAEREHFSNSFCMLKYVLEKYFDIYIYESDLYYGRYGKPYLKNKGIYYNISHSGIYIVIALSLKEIGIDIQLVKNKIDWDCFFSESESNMVKNDISDEVLGFSVLWSCKEAYLKKIGSGLAIDYSTILFNTMKTQFFYHRNIINWTVIESGSERYVLSLCLGID
ncbi:4'-phosphopantetheinyl transferase family protein [Streptococcus salivarius]|uniref:4'-phosphopantetheinyl transferase family protein n=1 Tax=Streptococcus salivarius TaxID=1304 RepID=UPI0016053E0C|nr:4'-phosphopantetheinyl transferase superfamily protein [Streptococcus salivarius]